MKLLWIVTLSLFAAALTLFAAADLAGDWQGSMETQLGVTDVTISVKPGATLAGTVKLGDHEGVIAKPVVNGSKIAFEVSIGPGTLLFEGTVAGNEMNLNVVGTQGNKYTLVCKRK